MSQENKETPGAATPGKPFSAQPQAMPKPRDNQKNRGVSADSKIFIGHVALGIDGSFATIGIKNPDDGSYLTATVNDDEVRLLTHALRTINEIAIRGD